MTNLNEQSKPETRATVAGRLHVFVMWIWHRLETPGAWILLMCFWVVSELIFGVTMIGGFWVAICLIAYFLSRIARAIEKIVEIEKQ